MSEKIIKLYKNPSFPGSYSGLDTFLKTLKDNGIKHNKNKVKKLLLQNETYTLHRPKRKKFERNQVIVSGIDDTWQADLVDVSSLSNKNDNFKFILTCLDVFSKYAWAVPLKNKEGKTITDAFKTIFTNRIPQRIQTDLGSEFYNRNFKALIKKYDIKLYSTQSEMKACIVERFNRTLKERMWRYFTESNNYRYIDVLDNLINSYNNTYHTSIKMKPIEVNNKNENQVFVNLYGYGKKKGSENPINIKLSIGDKVRISKFKRVFEKGYTPNWTREIFIIKKIITSNPTTYIIKDLDDEEIKGRFYEKELQKIYKYDEVFKIDEILETRINKKTKEKEYFVSWLGYPEKFNSWVNSIENI